MKIVSSSIAGMNALNGLFALEKEGFHLGGHKTFNEQCLKYLIKSFSNNTKNVGDLIVARVLLDIENGMHQSTKDSIHTLIKKQKIVTNTNLHYIYITNLTDFKSKELVEPEAAKLSELPILQVLKSISKNPDNLILSEDLIDRDSLVPRSLIFGEMWVENGKPNNRIHMIKFNKKNKLKFTVTIDPDHKGSDIIIHHLSKTNSRRPDDMLRTTYTSDLNFRMEENISVITHKDRILNGLSKFGYHCSDAIKIFDNIVELRENKADKTIKVNIGNPSQYRCLEMNIVKENDNHDSDIGMNIKIPYIEDKIEESFENLNTLDELKSNFKSRYTKTILNTITPYFKAKYSAEMYNDAKSYRLEVTRFKEMTISDINVKPSDIQSDSEPRITRSEVSTIITLLGYDDTMKLIFSDKVEIKYNDISGTEYVFSDPAKSNNRIYKKYTLEPHPTEKDAYVTTYADMYVTNDEDCSLHLDYKTNIMAYEEKLDVENNNIDKVKITTEIPALSDISDKVKYSIYDVHMVRCMYEDLIDSIIADECKYSTVNIEFK
jgi:hypothetical protein